RCELRSSHLLHVFFDLVYGSPQVEQKCKRGLPWSVEQAYDLLTAADEFHIRADHNQTSFTAKPVGSAYSPSWIRKTTFRCWGLQPLWAEPAPQMRMIAWW